LRPLRDHPDYVDDRGDQGKGPLPSGLRGGAIDWVDRVVSRGFRSVLCLSTDLELGYYDPLRLHDHGLRGLCEARGLRFEQVAWPDPAHGDWAERSQRQQMERDIKPRAWATYRRLDLPVLMFCSAAIQRSPPVAAYIAVREQGTR
jgi:hypothetical protein